MGVSALVRVPATSANLGPGYDCFGLALGRYDEVRAEPAPGGLRVEIVGVGADDLPRDGTNLVARAAAAAFDAIGAPVPGLLLTCRNSIPHGSGQGSSAAAIIAGVLLARALVPDGRQLLDDDAVLALATRMEGHPDNVAPALFGGFILAWSRSDGTPGAVRLPVHPAISAVAFTAERSCATAEARALLPATVPHGDAAANAAAAALMVHAMTVDPSLLLEATRDRLHQGYRAVVMPESAALLTDLRAAGIPAVLSGAGPSVLALMTAAHGRAPGSPATGEPNDRTSTAWPAGENDPNSVHSTQPTHGGVDLRRWSGRGFAVAPLAIDRIGAVVEGAPPWAFPS